MDLSNQNFGNWKALYPLKKEKRIYWHCKCICGEERDVLQYSLTSGKSKGCGCTANANKKYKDLKGQTFGELLVIEKTDKRNNGAVVWKCKCSCGTIVEWPGDRLQQTKYPNCGCQKSLIGEKFGKLTVIQKVDKVSKNRNQFWKCLCECGNTSICSTSDLRSGKVIGCGCSKSIGEYHITQILIRNKINFKSEYTFSDLKDKKLLRYDFAILDNNNNVIRLIEFDGEQHYNTKSTWYNETIHYHDIMKNTYAKKHCIPLVRIPYDKRDTITLQDILGSSYLI